jgi:hypothetical protein
LIIPDVQLGQAGRYDVVITNVAGSVTSSNALLAVNPLDHFDCAAVSSPQFVNVPFSITLLAKDPTDVTVTNFTGTVLLSATNGTAITLPVSASFTQGAWTGLVSVSQPSPTLVLQADDGQGHTGLTGPFSVIQVPSLSLIANGNNFMILWPVTATGFVLETSVSLAPAAWAPVTTTPVQNGGQFVVPVTTSDTSRFYLLRFSGNGD